MQFVINGPDIPNELLQAHEEDRVVFFTGAGISVPAGLPNFEKLVEEIYRSVGALKKEPEERAFKEHRYDTTLGLLDDRLDGGRSAVRKALLTALQPDLTSDDATKTHEALLDLSTTHEGVLRLVTTNFDRIFEMVAEKKEKAFKSYSGPLLPIPKNSRWNGLVYLHGLLPKDPDDNELENLVLSSGDFGAAYLIDRWASRFVGELFRNYIVCFVGYGINDPVLRYMMDALAADRLRGEQLSHAYAFGDYTSGDKDNQKKEWEAKGVIPIMYETPAEHDHSLLHSTLWRWAETHLDGTLGKESIVEQNAKVLPSLSTTEDDFVGRMLWALSDESGLPAKRFAELNPAPPLEWLDVFSEYRFTHKDLRRFNILPNVKDPELQFSLIKRPSPHNKSPNMSLMSFNQDASEWDNIMYQLARWLLRYLNDPELIVKMAEHSNFIPKQWSWMIKNHIEQVNRLKRNKETAKLDKIRENAPDEIPDDFMQMLWYLLLNGRVKSSYFHQEIYTWGNSFKHNGLTTGARFELRELLRPMVKLNEPFPWGIISEEVTSKEPKDYINVDFVLATDHARSSIRSLSKHGAWQEALPLLLNDFQQLLHDMLDLQREFGKADEESDRSTWHMPSVSEHSQNRGYEEWVVLIEVVRDAWLAIFQSDQQHGKDIARNWFLQPYPTFKRLALFAASQKGAICSDEWVSWLEEDDGWWLWSPETKRETMRLLVLQGAGLTPAAQDKLEASILSGPPKRMFREDIEENSFRELSDYRVWRHLAKFQKSDAELGHLALRRLNELSSEHPQWQLSENDRDEFSHWTGSSADTDFRITRDQDLTAPRKLDELVEWLKQTEGEEEPFHGDGWQEMCREGFARSYCALKKLSEEGQWSEKRWNSALWAWGTLRLRRGTWKYVAPLLKEMPDTTFKKTLAATAWWIEEASGTINEHQELFIALCERALTLDYKSQEDSDDDVVQAAINHPYGHITRALLKRWLSTQPNDNDGLPQSFQTMFTTICNDPKLYYGRVLLASHLIPLYRVDKEWTKTNLLPRFDWSNAPQAKALWMGFLWQARPYFPLFQELSEHMLMTAEHYPELGDRYSRIYASYLARIAHDHIDGYEISSLQKAIEHLPANGLHEVARYLVKDLEGRTADESKEHFKNHISPFWHEMWPKSKDKKSKEISETLVRLCIAAGNGFPSALATVKSWLQQIQHPHYVIALLLESNLSHTFPKEALELLSLIAHDQYIPSEGLRECLDQISSQDSLLTVDHRYKALDDSLRRYGL